MRGSGHLPEKPLAIQESVQLSMEIAVLISKKRVKCVTKRSTRRQNAVALTFEKGWRFECFAQHL
jgi:hypothetical protein